jgi:hypothetical protein
VRAALLAAALLLAMASVATAAVCQRPNGTLVVRDACRKRETAVDLGQLGYRGVLGAPGKGLRLVDAGGRTVPGVSAPLGEGSIFVYRAGTRIVFSEVKRDGFRRGVEFLHEEAGCTGPRLVRQPRQRLVRIAWVQDDVAYFAGDPVEAHTIVSIESSFYTPGECTTAGGTILTNGFCCLASSGVTESGPPATFELSALAVTPPFHLESAP